MLQVSFALSCYGAGEKLGFRLRLEFSESHTTCQIPKPVTPPLGGTSDEKNLKLMDNIEKIGASLAILGSFLPWEVAGDFVSSWTYGIRVFPVVRDSGGFLIVSLTLIFVLLTLRPPNFIKNTILWKFIVSALLQLHLSRLWQDG